ncbi:MAG: ArgR family transcriptional regulator [Pyrinomonadaceae bacterium]
MHKKDRHNTLLALIGARQIANQSELVASLREAGFAVTQASVSRDLDEMGIGKVRGYYSLPEKTIRDSGFGAVTFDIAGGNLIVGRCLSGLASALTVRIDAAEIPGIVGTIAGDDTIFIAVKDAARQGEVLKNLADLF